MRKIKAKSAFEIAVNMLDCAENGKYVYAVLFFDAAVAVMRNLVCYDDVSVFNINLNDPMCNNYNKEYYISLDPEYTLAIDPAWTDKNQYHDAGYLNYDADVVFIDGEAKAKIIDACETKAEMVELDMSDCDLEDSCEDEDCDECDDEECDCCHCDHEPTDEEKREFIKDFIEFLETIVEDD